MHSPVLDVLSLLDSEPDSARNLLADFPVIDLSQFASLRAVVASDTVLDAAEKWLWKLRAHYHRDAHLWPQEHNDWPRHKRYLQQQITTHEYRFRGPIQRRLHDGNTICVWHSDDLLVAQALNWVLHKALHESSRAKHCYTLIAQDRDEALLRIIYDARHYIRDKPQSYVAINHLQSHQCSALDSSSRVLLQRLLPQLTDSHELHTLLDSYFDKVEQTKGKTLLEEPLYRLRQSLALEPLDSALSREDCFYARFVDE